MSTYGYYTFVLPPPEQLTRQNHMEYHIRLKEMASWISDQKWDHWGSVPGGFYFNIEENYQWFMMRWGHELQS